MSYVCIYRLTRTFLCGEIRGFRLIYDLKLAVGVNGCALVC